MKRRALLFAALTFAGFSHPGAPLRAQQTTQAPAPIAPVISTSACQSYPQVTCTSSDALACADTLQMASDTRDQLAPVLNLGRTWRFPVHIHVLTPDDPLTARINREAAAVFSQGTTMKIEAVLPPGDPNAREFIQRQFVTALVWEKFFAGTTAFDRTTRLGVVPVWLVEGLREWLNDDPGHDRESIVRRAAQNRMAPTLTDVTGWHEMSDDRLLGLWQRAFCYYLVDSLIQEGPRRDDFQQWLAGFAGNSSSPAPRAQLHFPTEAGWQQELAGATGRSRDIVYTWEETSSELAAAETITFAATKDAPVQTCTLDTVADLPPSKLLEEALQERIFILTNLELRAHPSWHSILELYRSGLAALAHDDNSDQAKRLLQEAHRRRIAEMADHEKLIDYVNWFEVTKDYAGNASLFGEYFRTAHEMERVEADPAHPNPIRANLLQVESQL
jgi:hypothetical protein